MGTPALVATKGGQKRGLEAMGNRSPQDDQWIERAAEQRDGELGDRGPGGGKHSYMGNHRKEDRRGKRWREDDFRLPGGKSDVRKRMELRAGTEGHWEQISLGNSMRIDGKAAGKRGTGQRKVMGRR